MWRTKSRKRGHQMHTLRIRNACRQLARMRTIANDLQLVAQPLDGRTRRQDRSFQRVCRLARNAIRDRRQKPRRGPLQLLARIQHQEAARSVGRLHVTRRKTRLTHQRRLLVARHTPDRQAWTENIADAKVRRAVLYFRQQVHRHIEQSAKLLVPMPRANIKERRPRRIRGVRGVHTPSGQPPDQKTVDRPGRQLPPLRPLTRARNSIQNPRNL